MKVGGPWFGGGKTAAGEEGPRGRPTHKLRALVKSRTTDQLEQPAAPGIHNVHDLIAVRCLSGCSRAPVGEAAAAPPTQIAGRRPSWTALLASAIV